MKLHLYLTVLITTIELKHTVKSNALDITNQTIDTVRKKGVILYICGDIQSEEDSNNSNYDAYYNANMDENVDNENNISDTTISGETDSETDSDGKKFISNIKSEKEGTQNGHSNKNQESGVRNNNRYNNKKENSDHFEFHPKRLKSNGQEGDPCRNHYECSYEYENYLCHWRLGAEEGKCRRKSCRSNYDCKLFTDFPSKCQRGHCSIKFCYDNGECPKGFGCIDMICKQILGKCEYDCDCGDNNAICRKNFCYLKPGAKCKKNIFMRTEIEARKDDYIDIVLSSKNKESEVHNRNEFNSDKNEKHGISGILPERRNGYDGFYIERRNGQDGATCRNHYECSYEYEKYLCQWKVGVEEGKCRRKSCHSNNDCRLFTDFPSKCQSGHCRIKFCYGNGECPEGFGCNDMICKQILGTCEHDCDCGKNNVACHKKFCYFKAGNFNCS